MRNLHYIIMFLIIFSCSRQKDPKTFRSDNHKVIQAIDCYNSFKAPDNWNGNFGFKDSVLVVHNPEQGLYHDSDRLLVDKRPFLTIDENSGHALSAQMILSDFQGNIYVFYQKNNSNYSIIKKYDPAGRLLADLNEENGLEKISDWSFWDVDEKDNLFVCEYGYSGYPFLRFNKRGSLTVKELIPFRKNFLMGFFLRNNNIYLLTDVNIRDNRVIKISKVSEDLKFTRELYTKTCKPLIKVPIFSGSLTSFYKPYSKLKNKWAVDSEGLLYIADTSQYQISVYNQNGELVKVIDRPDYKPLKVTDIDKQVYYDRQILRTALWQRDS
ncbi:hypothetical protein J7K93_11595 [bacterium]|nr:hypothetical protein [bacterium]